MTGIQDTIQDLDNYSNFSNSSTLYDSKDIKPLPQHDTTEHHRPVRGRLDKAMDMLKRKRSSKPASSFEDSKDNSVPDIKRNAEDNILSPDGSVETLLSHQGSTTPSTRPEMLFSDSSTIQEDHNQDSAYHNSETGSMKVPRGKLLDKLRGSRSGKTADQGSSTGAAQNQGNQPLVQEGGPSSGSAEKSPPSSSGSGSNSGSKPSESDPDAPIWYFIMTKRGTSISEFNAFVENLDGSKWPKTVDPNVPFQAYNTFLKPSEVAGVKSNPIIRHVMKDEWFDDSGKELYNANPKLEIREAKQKRADKPPAGQPSGTDLRQMDLDFQNQSPNHLSLISQGPGSIKEQKAAKGKGEGNSMIAPYMLSPKAGEGVTIFIIDGGLNPKHPDFAKAYDPKEFFIASHHQTGPHPNNFHGQPYRPESETIMMDKIGHGNCMASLAGGAVYGVSKKAKLVPVKYKYQLGAASHQAIAAAFTYIIGKVKTATQPGTAVINLSGGYRKDLFKSKDLFEDRKALLDDYLKECWENDIVTVIATSNNGDFPSRNLGEEVPACLGRPDNPLITVGAATADGKRYHKTTKEDGGSISVWAKGDMPTYCAATEGSGSQKQDGSSGAAAQISGLAAYFLSLSKKELAVPKNWPMKATVELYGLDLHVKGKVAQLVKDYIVAMSHVRTEGGVNMAYNGAEERVCEVVKASDIKQKRAAAPKKNAYGLTPLIVAGKLVGSRPGLSSCPARSSQPPGSSKTASKTKTGASKATSLSRAAIHSAKKAKGRPVQTAKARQARATDLSSKQER